jgi:hypothetical protein
VSKGTWNVWRQHEVVRVGSRWKHGTRRCLVRQLDSLTEMTPTQQASQRSNVCMSLDSMCPVICPSLARAPLKKSTVSKSTSIYKQQQCNSLNRSWQWLILQEVAERCSPTRFEEAEKLGKVWRAAKQKVWPLPDQIGARIRRRQKKKDWTGACLQVVWRH